MKLNGIEVTRSIQKALDFAIKYHEGQLRKWTFEPYIVHPIEVAEIVSTVEHTEDMIIAALLHDVVEDCSKEHGREFLLSMISALFGSYVCKLVEMLTDVSKPSDGNRAKRKEIDRLHNADAMPEAKTIRLADLISNTRSIVRYDNDFAKIYLREKALMLEVLKEGNPILWEQARILVYRHMEKL